MANVRLCGFFAASISSLCIVGCVASPDANPGESVSTTSQTIWRGDSDSNDGWANAVVRIGIPVYSAADHYGTCTGTLIAPRLVLTAHHCLFGSSVGKGETASPAPDSTLIYFGNDRNSPIRTETLVPGGQYSYLGRNQPSGKFDYGREVALLVLSHAVVDEAYSIYPAIQDLNWPIGQGWVSTFPAVYSGWGIDENNTLPQYRKIHRYNDFDVYRLSFEPDAVEFVAKWGDIYYGTDSGDSGGPLFMTGAPESVQPLAQLGVLTQRNAADNEDNSSVWADITFPPVRDWLAKTGADPKRPGKWLGETDYTGPCDQNGSRHDGQLDADCDRWFDSPGHDNCIGLSNPDQDDRDGDGVGNECDNCLSVSNSDQADFDKNGRGDLCDPCVNFGGDFDGDSVCDDLDNCKPSAKPKDLNEGKAWANPDQNNCNKQWELAHNAVPLGDECDPVPCPDNTPDVTEQCTTVYGSVSKKNCLEKLNGFNIKLLAARGGANTTGVSNATATGTSFPTSVTETRYRYCWNNSKLNINCTDASVLDESLLKKGGTAASEQVSDPWHRIGMNTAGIDAWEANLPYNDNVIKRTWDFTSDFSRWNNVFGTDAQLPTSFPAQFSKLQGQFWVNSDSPYGMWANLANSSGENAGLHLQNGGGSTDQLSNNIVPVVPDHFTTKIWANAVVLDPILKMQHCPQCLSVFRPWEKRIHEPDLLVSTGVGTYGTLEKDGYVLEATDKLGPHLRASLADPALVWASPAEPASQFGVGLLAPMAVALSNDGLSIVQTVHSNGQMLFGERDLERVIEKAATNSIPSTAMPARSGFKAVYAQSIATIFVIGGVDTAKAPTGDIWSRPVASSDWTRLETGSYSPSDVISSTYSFVDGHLWVLDQQKIGFLKFARLARIDTQTGKTKIIGMWLRLGIFDKQWLVVDKDGGVILAASSKRLHKHILLKLTANGEDVRPTGGYFGQWALATQPVVDLGGYTLIREPKPNDGARMLRTKTLFASTATWQDVGQCL